MAATAKKPAPRESERLTLCRELLQIRRDNLPIFTRIDAISTRLKTLAGTEGKFREVFDELGYVSVSPAAPEQVTGTEPVLQVRAWLALRAARQQKLIEDGLVAIRNVVKRATYGQVRFKLHAEVEGDE